MTDVIAMTSDDHCTRHDVLGRHVCYSWHWSCIPSALAELGFIHAAVALGLQDVITADVIGLTTEDQWEKWHVGFDSYVRVRGKTDASVGCSSWLSYQI